MAKGYKNTIEFPLVKRRHVKANFSVGDITNNAEITLLAQLCKKLKLREAVTEMLTIGQLRPFSV